MKELIMDPEKQELYVAKKKSGLNTEVDISSVVSRLKDDDGDINWLLMTVDAAVNALQVHGCGGGGVDELTASLNDDSIFYGVFKCKIADKTKYFHLYFVGSNVSAMKKGKGSLNKNAIFQLVDAHGEISCSTGLESFNKAFVTSELAHMVKLSEEDIVIP